MCATGSRGTLDGTTSRYFDSAAGQLPLRGASVGSARVVVDEAGPHPMVWPMVLAEGYRIMAPGSSLVIDGSAPWPEVTGGMDLSHLVEGSGFILEDPPPRPEAAAWRLAAHRAHSLADTVGPDMGVLVCGLNPSHHAALAGYGFAGPGNRFWPAATAAGLLSVPGDPRHALEHHGVGMTDLVKRATPRAAALSRAEYEHGMERLTSLCRWLRPHLVCVVGITGWRAASGDRSAVLGPQPIRLGDRPVYVMPNPSGLNPHTSHDDLVAHFVEVRRRGMLAG